MKKLFAETGRRAIVLLLACGPAISCLAQPQPAKVARIGFVSALSYSAFPSRIEAFRHGLKELGYVEGRNVVVEYRWAEGKAERLPEIAAELERLNVDVLVSGGPSVTRPAIRATKRTPIVMAFDTDPVGSGFIASLARPGGRVTGLSILAPEISAKQIDLLKQIVPRISRLAVLGDSNEPGNGKTLEQAERAARRLGIDVRAIDLRGVREVEATVQALQKEGVDALLFAPSPLVTSRIRRITEAVAKAGLPAIYWGPHHVEAGGLMTYSANVDDLFRRTAIYVDRILKGARAGDIPVEEPTKFDLVINLKAAKQIGLEIPMTLLTRADRIIR